VTIPPTAGRNRGRTGAPNSLQNSAGSTAAAAADPTFQLALGHLHGLDAPQDLSVAHALLRESAGKGNTAAARVRAHLIAAGVGVPADLVKATQILRKIAPRDAHAKAQLDMLKHVADPVAPRRVRVNASPDIILVERLLAPEECRYLISVAEPRVEPAMIGNPTSGGHRFDPVRTSYDSAFAPGDEDLVFNRINHRIARVTGTKYEWGEPLHILRYTPGQEYKPHMDTIDGAPNQRFWTALIYLNDGYKGGETDFPRLDIRVEGAMGDALLFCSLDKTGRPDPLTEHAGLPVTSGTKWLATRWIRRAPHNCWEG
jgi:prolyl 4-hydroxylase